MLNCPFCISQECVESDKIGDLIVYNCNHCHACWQILIAGPTTHIHVY